MVYKEPPVFGPPTKPPVYTLSFEQKRLLNKARKILPEHLENLQGPVPKGHNRYYESVAKKAEANSVKGGKRKTRKSKKSRKMTRRRR